MAGGVGGLLIFFLMKKNNNPSTKKNITPVSNDALKAMVDQMRSELDRLKQAKRQESGIIDGPRVNAPVPGRDLLQDYIACLADPKNNMSRIPDAEPRETSLFRSVTVIDVIGNFAGNPDDGRFAIAVQPTFGKDGTDPTLFKVASAVPGFNLGSVTPTDWANAASYSQYLGGVNVREDPYVTQMTGAPANFFGLASGGVLTAARPLGTAPTQMPGTVPGVIDFDPVTGTALGSAGVYEVHLSAMAAAGISITPSVISDPPGLASLTLINQTSNGLDANSSTYVLDAKAQWALSWSTSIAPLANGASMTIVPISADNFSRWQNNGAVTSVRPVAMSTFFTNALSGLTDGGMIAGAYVPPATCQSNFFTNAVGSAVGQLQDWNKLAILGSSNALKKGNYVWWSPQDVTDLQFLDPERMNQHDYPCLIVSGQAVTGLPAPGDVFIGRLEITTVYEFTTNMPLWESDSLCGNSVIIDEAFNFLHGQHHVMENDSHFDWIKKLLKATADAAKRVGKFAYDNRQTIIPLAIKALSV